MSHRKNKSDYVILGVLLLITIGFLLIFILLDLSGKKHSDAPGTRTTLSTNVDGAIVCYTLFDRLGISVNREKKPFLNDVPENIDVLFLLDQVVPLHNYEIKNLNSWLKSGGVFICTNVPKGLFLPLEIYTKPSTPGRSNELRDGQTCYIPPNYSDLPLARDISSLSFKTENYFDKKNTNPGPTTNDVETLLRDDLGDRIIKCRVGAGYIIVLSDTTFLSNGLIDNDDNSVLAANLVSYTLSLVPNKNVVFDEYHLNPSYAQSGFGILSKMLFTTTAGWSVLSLTVAGIFYIILKGRRFGYRRGTEKKQRRSKLEYIYSVGSTYQSAGANRLTLKIIYEHLRNKINILTGMGPNESNTSIAKALSRHKGYDLKKYIQTFDKCDKLMSQKSVSERQLSSVLKELSLIEMEIFNEHRNNT